jgi:hypothetical protein
VTSTERRYFEEMYESSRDPWNYSTSWYERRKYALTVAALPRVRYPSAFEPGCSIGVLSELLAVRCDRLLATDILPAPLERASERLHRFPGVIVEQRAIPESWPKQRFDLVVLSELAYYFDAETLSDIVLKVTESTDPGADLVAVHWRGETDYPLTGDQAHELIDGCPKFQCVARHVEERFVLDVWERTK